MTEPLTLGMTWGSRGPSGGMAEAPAADRMVVNTRDSLWPARWPAIALKECIEKVEAAPMEDQAQVKWDLPCQACPMNTACLNAKRKEVGSLMYSREILTKPRTSESSLFPDTLYKPLLDKSANCVPHWRKPFSVEHEYAVVQAWDIAWSEKTGGDWLVCMTAVIHRKSGQRRLLDVERWQQRSFQQQIDLIAKKHTAYQADLVVIEGDAAQQVWKQQVAETTSVPVTSHDASGKHTLAVGVPSLLILFENRKWEFPHAEGYHKSEVDVFLNELEAFGWVDGKLQGVGEHDDTVMAFWHLNWGLDKFTAGRGTEESYRGIQDGEQI